MIYIKFWSPGFYQFRVKVDQVKRNVKIKLPTNVQPSWVDQVCTQFLREKLFLSHTRGHWEHYHLKLLSTNKMPPGVAGMLLMPAGLWSHEHN